MTTTSTPVASPGAPVAAATDRPLTGNTAIVTGAPRSILAGFATGVTPPLDGGLLVP